MQGDRVDAKNECPWAAIITKVEGGYMCFESSGDYLIWSKQ